MEALFTIPIASYEPDRVKSLCSQAGCNPSEARQYLRAIKKTWQKRTERDWEIINYVDTCLARSASFLLTPTESGEVTLWNQHGEWTFTKGLGGADKLSPVQLIDLFEFLNRMFPRERRLDCSVYSAYRTLQRLKCKSDESKRDRCTIYQCSPILRSLVNLWRWVSAC